jgi:hypothetical protein
VDPGAGAIRPPLPEGFYPELMIEKIVSYDGKDPKKKGAHYFRADVEVLVATEQCKAGVGGCFMEQVAGNQYDDHDIRALGSVKSFVGAALGLEDKAAINAVATPEYLVSLSKDMDGKKLAGHVFAARVSHTESKAGNTICKFECFPVLDANGQPKRVGVKSAATSNDAPPPPPASTPPGAPASLESMGWKKHPTSPGFWYKQGGKTSYTEAQIRAGKAG